MESHGVEIEASDSSEDEASPEERDSHSPSTQEIDRTPSDRHGFLFKHNLATSPHDLREFHPLPSQIPFLLDTFSENVNCVVQIVYMPTVTKMVRDLRSSNMIGLSPANEALIFSIYYAAITSMDENDVSPSYPEILSC